jgi:cytochrome c-type biogenesis protein CcmH
MTTFIVVAAFMAVLAAAAVAVPLFRDRQSRLLGAIAGVLIAAAAAGLYPLWSNWNWRAPAEFQAADPKVLAMVAKLEGRLRDEPRDLDGWLMLGRSYMALERMDDAIIAYDHAVKLDPKNAEAALGLGEAMSLRAGGSITPAAAQLFEQALVLEPDSPKALLYGGFAAAVRGDYAVARARWEALKGLHPPPEIEKLLDARIAELGPAAGAGAAAVTPASGSGAGPGAFGASAAGPAGAGPGGAGPGALGASAVGPAGASPVGAGPGGAGPGGAGPGGAGEPSPAAAAGAEVTVTIGITPALKARLTGDAPLFIFAREPGGAGPPLAAKRLTSAAIGTQIRLSAADSMVPGRALVNGQHVAVTARVSFSGQPLPAAGDLYGELTYDVGHDGARDLVINRVAE